VAAEELHEPPQPRLAAEVRRDARGLLPAYAAYLREQLRMVFEHVEGLFPESVHDERGCCRAYALDGAAREVGVDGLRRTGQAALGVLGPELAAVARVGHPFPEGVQLLARAGRGQSSDDGGYSARSEEHTSELQSRFELVCRLLLEKKTRLQLDSISIH